MHAIARAALRFLQRVREERDDDARRADDEERGPPSELRADRAPERDAEAEPDEHHHLLVREDAAPAAGGVVVGEQARRRRFRDRLPEAEQRAHPDEHPEALRGRGQHRDEAPAQHRVTDGAAAVPPVGEVARGHGDEPVHEHERRQQHADLGVVDVEVGLDLADHAAHDVLVDLVDHDDHAEDPHRPTRDVRFVARPRSFHRVQSRTRTISCARLRPSWPRARVDVRGSGAATVEPTRIARRRPAAGLRESAAR